MVTQIHIERKVLDLVETYNGRSLFTLKRRVLTLDTDLNADMKMDPIEARDLLEDYFTQFDVDPARFDFPRRLHPRRPEPLTIRMLVESARAKRWLYD
jgi:hypothetical protein